MTFAPAGERALVVPDPACWAAAGVDVGELGIEPVSAPSRADLMVLPARLPRGLVGAVREARTRLPDPAPVRLLDGWEVHGAATNEILDARGEDRGANVSHEAEHGDHEQMMAVSGEPSSDGLVMESAETRFGPLGPAVPTGLVWRITLDGDVVCESRLESAVSRSAPRGAAPDPLAPAAWRWARERANRSRSLAPSLVPPRLAGVELERALSHLMWLARLCDVVGCLSLSERLRRRAAPLIRSHAGVLRDAYTRPRLPAIERIRAALAQVRSDRGLAGRLRGIADVTRQQCRDRGVGGPVARASGLDADARRDDPGYRELGFTPARRDSGDAAARTAVRIEESLSSLELACRALELEKLPVGDGPVEGPRGPVVAERFGPSGALALAAPAAAPARDLAAASALGHELARAVVAVTSFDLSPWEVSA